MTSDAGNNALRRPMPSNIEEVPVCAMLRGSDDASRWVKSETAANVLKQEELRRITDTPKSAALSAGRRSSIREIPKRESNGSS